MIRYAENLIAVYCFVLQFYAKELHSILQQIILNVKKRGIYFYSSLWIPGFPVSLNGYRLAIGYLSKVKVEGVTPPRFLGGLRDWVLWLVFGFSSSYRLGFQPGYTLKERENSHKIFRVGYVGARACRQCNLVLYFRDLKFKFRSYFGHSQVSA